MAPQSAPPAFSKRWQIHKYGTREELTLVTTARTPTMRKPTDILIEVHAASVNPIDTLMLQGYGAATLNIARRKNGPMRMKSEFPLTLGRDFSGVVIDTGKRINPNKFKIGDEVWGALDASRQGTHAHHIIASVNEISKKPLRLNHIEAASIPYVANTTWAALCANGHLNEDTARGKRVLILGGSGGIGTFAIQLLKAWGAEVTTTCSTDACGQLIALGADVVIDYKAGNVWGELMKIKGFDIVYDTLGGDAYATAIGLLKVGGNSRYISISSPVLKNNDKYGLPLGLAMSAVNYGSQFLVGLQQKNSVSWAFFVPNANALKKVAKMVDDRQIAPVIEKVYSFEELPCAYDKVAAKHCRGKTVVNMKSESKLNVIDF